MAMAAAQGDALWTNLLIAAVGVGAALGGAAWDAAAATAVLSGIRLPGDYGAPWLILSGDMDAAWGTYVGPAWLYWAVLA